MIWLMVAAGGGLGSLARYGAGQAALRLFGPDTVLATLLVNVTGSLLLGFFATLALEKLTVPVELRAFVAVGLLGGYTTFSTLAFETVRIVETGEVIRASLSMGGNIVLGLVAAFLGIWLARAV